MRATAQLRRLILSRKATIGIVGQGYVGLSLACAAAEAGFPVRGFDIDDERVRDLRAATLSVPGVSEAEFGSAMATGRIEFGSDPGLLGDCDVVAICVPTPARDNQPDLSYVEEACRTVAGAGFSRRHANGGRVMLSDCGWPCASIDAVRVSPRLPRLLPP